MPWTRGGAPQVSGVSPTTGTHGTVVALTGTGFTGTSVAKFVRPGVDVHTASFTVDSDTLMHVTCPTLPASDTYTIVLGDGDSEEHVGTFTYSA